MKIKVAIRLIGVTFILVSLVSACKFNEQFSPIPQIWYKSFVLLDTIDDLENPVKMGILTFDFRDGDGDFGLPTPNENTPPELQQNLFISGFYADGTEILPMPENNPISSFSFRIPSFDDEVFGKPYEGTVRVEMLFYSIPYKSVLYHFYVTDRAGNKSNTDQTDLIQLGL